MWHDLWHGAEAACNSAKSPTTRRQRSLATQLEADLQGEYARRVGQASGGRKTGVARF